MTFDLTLSFPVSTVLHVPVIQAALTAMNQQDLDASGMAVELSLKPKGNLLQYTVVWHDTPNESPPFLALLEAHRVPYDCLSRCVSGESATPTVAWYRPTPSYRSEHGRYASNLDGTPVVPWTLRPTLSAIARDSVGLVPGRGRVRAILGLPPTSLSDRIMTPGCSSDRSSLANLG